MSETINLPPIGSEWYEDDSRVYPGKVTVVGHYNSEKVLISRHSLGKHATRASAKRFGKSGGYKPWALRSCHKLYCGRD
jgi:hypothetical protein